MCLCMHLFFYLFILYHLFSSYHIVNTNLEQHIQVGPCTGYVPRMKPSNKRSNFHTFVGVRDQVPYFSRIRAEMLRLFVTPEDRKIMEIWYISIQYIYTCVCVSVCAEIIGDYHDHVYPILSYPILFYPILSYPIHPNCPILFSYPILSCPILSYPSQLSYPIFLSN